MATNDIATKPVKFVNYVATLLSNPSEYDADDEDSNVEEDEAEDGEEDEADLMDEPQYILELHTGDSCSPWVWGVISRNTLEDMMEQAESETRIAARKNNKKKAAAIKKPTKRKWCELNDEPAYERYPLVLHCSIAKLTDRTASRRRGV